MLVRARSSVYLMFIKMIRLRLPLPKQIAHVGGIDLLINSAGVNVVGHIDAVSEELWDTCLDSNLKGVFLASREAVPRMRARGGSVIIYIASNSGVKALAADSVYCASKAGLVMLTQARHRLTHHVLAERIIGHVAEETKHVAESPGPFNQLWQSERPSHYCGGVRFHQRDLP